MACRAFIPLDFGVMKCFLTMNIYQTAFCVLLAHSIFNFIKALATLSYNLIKKTCKSFIYSKKRNEKMEVEFSVMTLSTRILSIALPIISAILWVIVIYYSIFDDAKAAIFSYFACASIFIFKYVFLGTNDVNSVYLRYLNHLAFLLTFVGCLLLSNLYMTAFYLMCLGILMFKMKYELEQMRRNYFFEDTEVSRGNFLENITRPHDLTAEGLTVDFIAYPNSSKVKEQSTDITEKKSNGLIKRIYQNDDTKSKEDNVFQLEKHACENNNCSGKPKDIEKLHNLNKSTEYFPESLCSENVVNDCALKFSEELYPESVDKVIDISDPPKSASKYKKNGIEEMRAKIFQNLVDQNTNALKVESIFTTDSQHNAQINSAEYTSDKTCSSLSRVEANEKLGDTFNRCQPICANGESQPLDVRNRWHDQRKILVCDRQQLIDKVCEDIKSKIKEKNMQIQTDPIDETEELYRLIKQSSMFSHGVSGPPCLINKTDQMSSYPADMINASLRKFNENKCIDWIDYPISNEQSNFESKSPLKHTQIQSSGNDSSSTNPLLVDPEVAKPTKIEDSELYQNSCEKRGKRFGMQSESENSDTVISENKIDESAAGVSAVASVTHCSSAISSIAGTVNRIDVRFIYGVGHPFACLKFDFSNVKLQKNLDE